MQSHSKMALLIYRLKQYHQLQGLLPACLSQTPANEKMQKTIIKHILNFLLVTGCIAVIATTAVITSVNPARASVALTPQTTTTTLPSLPPLNAISTVQPQDSGVTRKLYLKTKIPSGPPDKMIQYTVQSGDSPWSIAKKFNLKPESILWANEELNASAGSLKPGMTLNILPVNGVLHTVSEGDTLDSIGKMHEANVEDILEFPGNDFDLTQAPKLEQGQQIIVPNGVSPILWSEVQAPGAGQSAPGEHYSGKVAKLGTGSFIWPVNSNNLTQEFWSGHLGIDIQTVFRQPVFAADSGTVIFSGWDTTGYGNFIVIDHGNGFKTTYGHNEAILVSVGQTIVKGQQISESGSTGNSTGNHLDFRIIYNGVFVNPMNYLP